MTRIKTIMEEEKTIRELVDETRTLQKIEQQLRDASEITVPEFQGI